MPAGGETAADGNRMVIGTIPFANQRIADEVMVVPLAVRISKPDVADIADQGIIAIDDWQSVLLFRMSLS